MGDRVWKDLNGNGIQDKNVLEEYTEPGIPNVKVTLTGTDAYGQPVSITKETDAKGNYLFTELCASQQGTKYTVTVDEATLPIDVIRTDPRSTNGDDNNPNDSNEPTGTTVTINTDNGSNLTIDFGYEPLCAGAIGNQVWKDIPNGNGTYETGEPGISGVQLSLTGTDVYNKPVNLFATTNAIGEYSFKGLCQGTYTVKVESGIPAGFVLTTNTPSSDGNDGVDNDSNNPASTIVTLFTDKENNQTLDFGYVPKCAGSIGDFVWKDLNENGIQESGEPGIDGVRVHLSGTNNYGQLVSMNEVTQNGGKYTFHGVCQNAPNRPYTVTIDPTSLPGGYFATSPRSTNGSDNNGIDSNEPNGTSVIMPDDSTNNDSVDFGYYPCTGAIGDFVWYDNNGNGLQDDGTVSGISSVNVQLTGKNIFGQSIDLTSTTDENGYYHFIALCKGTYTVAVNSTTLPSGAVPTSPLGSTNGNDGVGNDSNRPNGTSVELYTSASSIDTVDFGYYKPAFIGDRVWEDKNNNGLQDAGEPGIANIKVDLFDCSGNYISTTNTLADGSYSFSVAPGSYYVVVVKPAGYSFSPSFQGTDKGLDSNTDMTGKSDCITVASGETNNSVDSGLYKNATIGDFVWEDKNNNGVQDANEPGISGVTVELRDCKTDALVATTTTGANGIYSFSVAPGSYYIVVVKPAGYSFSPSFQGTDKGLDSNTDMNGKSDCITVASGETNNSVDSGLYKNATIGDFVWEDKNNNGVQDANEPGISGVTVELRDCKTDALVATTTTGANGIYSFSVAPGSYYVVVVKPAGYSFSPSFQGTDKGLDSNTDMTGKSDCITVASGETNNTVDSGLYKSATIGDFVWEDKNNNGIQDAGEMPVANVRVELYDCNGNYLNRFTTTDVNGLYKFDNLVPGSYKVKFILPSGYTFSMPYQGGNTALDSNANQTTGMSECVTVASGETNNTIDAGLYKKAAIGNFVWEDKNNNGIQDAGEPGIAGVTVNLFKCDNTPVGTATTDINGFYKFDNLMPGCYYVKFTTPAGYSASPANQGNDDTKDSDSVGGITDNYTLVSGEYNDTVDAGFYKPFVCIPCKDGVKQMTLKLNYRTLSGDPNEMIRVRADGLNGQLLFERSGIAVGDTFTFDVPLAAKSVVVTVQGKNHYSETVKATFSAECDLTTGQVNGNSYITFKVEAAEFDGDKTCTPVCIPCKDGVKEMTLMLNWRTATGDPNERIRVRADGISGQVLFDSWSDSDTSNKGIPVGASFTFSVPLAAKSVVVTVQGINHSSETLKATFSAECDLAKGQINGNSYITFKVVDAMFDGDAYCGKASIGDYVWKDLNKNGIQEYNEFGYSGVTVKLFTCGGTTPLASTTTDATGNYLFGNLVPGSYSLQFVLPSGYAFSPMDQGMIDTVDSDANTTTGATVCTTLAAGENDLSWDAGIYKKVVGCTYTIGYWKNHAGFGPQADVVTPLLPVYLGTAGGSKTIKVTTALMAYDLLSQNKYGTATNGITKLYAQLLAAKLSIKAGADSSAVASTIAAADSFLASYNYSNWTTIGSTNQSKVNAWHATLDSYNNGITGPGHCGSQEDVACVDISKMISVDSGKTWLMADTEATAAVRSSSGTVMYKFIVNNCGLVKLTNIDIDDSALGISNYIVASLDAGASATLTSSQIPKLTAASQCATSGVFENVASATAVYNGSTYTDSDSAWLKCNITTTCIDVTKEISVDGGKTWKPADTSAAAPSVVAPGAANYRITVKNCGTAKLSDVTMNDPELGISGYIVGTLSGGASKTYTSAQISTLYDPKACTAAGAVLNTATASGTYSGKTVTDSDPAWLVCTGTVGGGCTKTYGYWKTHTIYDGVKKQDKTWTQAGGENQLFFKTGQSWYDVLMTTPSGGNAYYILAHQYIAAILNKTAGANTSVVDAHIAHAAELLDQYDGYPIKMTEMSGSVRNDFVDTAALLDQYNNGVTGPGHCK